MYEEYTDAGMRKGLYGFYLLIPVLCVMALALVLYTHEDPYRAVLGLAFAITMMPLLGIGATWALLAVPSAVAVDDNGIRSKHRALFIRREHFLRWNDIKAVEVDRQKAYTNLTFITYGQEENLKLEMLHHPSANLIIARCIDNHIDTAYK